jgi:hypothetical protein
MSRRQVETDLEGLPPSDELIDACDGELTPDDLQEIRGIQKSSSERRESSNDRTDSR